MENSSLEQLQPLTLQKSRNEKSKMVIKSKSSTPPKTPTLSSFVGTSNAPNPMNFFTFMPWACKMYNIDVIVQPGDVVMTQKIRDRKKQKKKDTTGGNEDGTTTTSVSEAKEKSPKSSSNLSFMVKSIYASYDAIRILAKQDAQNNLIKLNFYNNKEIPRNIFIILTLIVKYYPALTTLSVNSGINEYSIYEISKLVQISALREICLDDTRLKNPNYHMLLEKASNLTCLSLTRSQIGDDSLKQITDLLVFPLPASKTLTHLNLSTNKISDKGAVYLAQALRTNRTIVNLNLANNHISDRGASCIFDMLMQFSITAEELVLSGTTRLKYLKQKKALVARFMAELKTAEQMKTGKKSMAVGTNKQIFEGKESVWGDAKNKQIYDRKYMDKAEILAKKTLGEYKDPLQNPEPFTKEGKVYCIGNTVLASLNMAYNNLSFISVKKLLKVLKYQNNLVTNPRGLFRVIMEGNYLPKECHEYAEINELLNKSLDVQQPVSKIVRLG